MKVNCSNNMRSIRYINRYLRIGNSNFEVVNLINNIWIIKFNDTYYGYVPVRDGDILRKIPGVLNQYCGYYYNREDCEYWFLGLKPKNVEYAYSIVGVGGDVHRIDKNNFIKI